MFQMALLLIKENNCANLIRNSWILNKLWPDKLNLDRFITWLTSVTLTFNRPEQMFQTALLLLKENICAKLFSNPCINVDVMAGHAQCMTISSLDLQV